MTDQPRSSMRHNQKVPLAANVRVRCAVVIVAYVFLAAPVVAALLFWGSWGWVAAALVVAGLEIATLNVPSGSPLAYGAASAWVDEAGESVAPKASI